MVGKETPIPAKIVCVRNKSNRKDWLAFICTDTTLSEEEIIRVYGKRWQIEVFFKTCKSMLNLIGECHSLSYDALTTHVAIVFTRYMLLAMEQRQNEDQRTLGKLFFLLIDEMADITFNRSLHPDGCSNGKPSGNLKAQITKCFYRRQIKRISQRMLAITTFVFSG